jgi:hypothetical protein
MHGMSYGMGGVVVVRHANKNLQLIPERKREEMDRDREVLYLFIYLQEKNVKKYIGKKEDLTNKILFWVWFSLSCMCSIWMGE